MQAGHLGQELIRCKTRVIVPARRSDDRRSAPRGLRRRDHLRCGGAALSGAGARVQRRGERARHRGRSAGRRSDGTVRAGTPLRFPRETLKAEIFPDLDQYRGPPLEFGRMEPTASDPAVQQQFGMIAGIPNAGQLNALATLNIRGERSVTCRGDFDRHPSLGPLPPGAPPVCEFFRHLPDALERAAELDATYGRNPDFDELPMYGVVLRSRIRSTPRICARPAAPTRVTTSTFRRAIMGLWSSFAKGRDNLRQDGEYRIQRPRGRSRWPASARKGAALDPWLSAKHLGRQSVEPLRHYAFCITRVQLGLGAGGQREHGDGSPRRGDARLLPRPLQPQCRGVDPAAQGDAGL